MQTLTLTTQRTGTFRSSHRALACAVLLALPLWAGAHDLVLIPEPSGDLTVRFGHPGDWQQADRERLLDLQAEGGAGAATPITSGLVSKGQNLEAPRVAPAGQATLVTARYDNGLWVTTPDAAGKPVYHNTTKAMLPQASGSMAALKYAKALYTNADDSVVYKREAKHLIELIPQRNPAGLKPGDMLAVLVKFNGKPLAKAGVEVTDASTMTVQGQAKYATNAAGIAQVPIRNPGLNVISVDHEQKNDGSLGPAMKSLPVDRVAVIATYAFQVR